jgi:uncharacterized repeat protein (TIGR03803 family)
VKSAISSLRDFVALGLFVLSLAAFANAATEKILHYFRGTDGSTPYAGVVIDTAGNLYGTTFYGGGLTGCDCGVVFKLTPNGTTWTESTLYAFTGGSDGAHPYSPLVFDTAGNLYGTTFGAYSGGGSGVGTVFKLTPNADGSWSFSLLYTFRGGTDGVMPSGPIVLDPLGNLYGTTDSGGGQNAGTAFELSPTARGPWKETQLHRFTGGKDGLLPAGLALGPAGTLFGWTPYGGAQACACGVVYELSRVGGNWTQTIVHTFTGGTDGARPGTLVFNSGILYGAATIGGATSRCFNAGCGVVFQLTQNSNQSWSETVLHTFSVDTGQEPDSLIFGIGGQLYGAAYAGGPAEVGLIFELSPANNWAETVLHDFVTVNDGANPIGALALDHAGHIYGATILSGPKDAGVVFEVLP